MKSTSILKAGISTLLFSTILASTAGAVTSIGVNFVNNSGPDVQNGDADALSSSDIAGVQAQANWNNYGRWGNANSPVDSTGSATSVTVAWDSQGTWSQGNTNSTPNQKLMNGYLDSNGSANTAVSSPYSIFPNHDNQPAIYVSGLSSWLTSQGATSYSVILYIDGDGTDGRQGEYWLQNASGDHQSLTVGSDLTGHIFNADTANFSGAFVQATATTSVAAVYGNYIVFSGLTANSFLARNDDPFRAPTSGFQIVADPVPEPASVVLLGLAAGGLLSRRRRTV